MYLRLLAAGLLLVLGTAVQAESWASKLPVGSLFPDIVATDQSGKTWNRENMAGEQGLLILFNRSIVW